jgi:hypothetical protein
LHPVTKSGNTDSNTNKQRRIQQICRTYITVSSVFHFVFSPVLRMHGDREPHGKALSDKGGGLCISGADNEIWSFGEEVESILVVYLQLRERLRPYIRTQMRQAHQAGTPLMRPLCYDFPDDKHACRVHVRAGHSGGTGHVRGYTPAHRLSAWRLIMAQSHHRRGH